MKSKNSLEFMIQTLNYIIFNTILCKIENDILGKVVSTTILFHNCNFDKLRKFLYWLPKEVVEKTFSLTTQLAMGSSKILTFRQYSKSIIPHLNLPRLAETFNTDTLFYSEVGIGVIACTQLFVGKK